MPVDHHTMRTPERTALLRAEWPAGVASWAILARYNALPGGAIDIQRLGVEASDLRLRRPPGFHHSRAPATLSDAPMPREVCPLDVEASRHVILSEPVEADFECVAAWAVPRGIVCTWWDDLRRVNDKRAELGLPPFKRKFPRRGVYAAGTRA
jgi:hypothetical protein